MNLFCFPLLDWTCTSFAYIETSCHQVNRIILNCNNALPGEIRPHPPPVTASPMPPSRLGGNGWLSIHSYYSWSYTQFGVCLACPVLQNSLYKSLWTIRLVRDVRYAKIKFFKLKKCESAASTSNLFRLPQLAGPHKSTANILSVASHTSPCHDQKLKH